MEMSIANFRLNMAEPINRVAYGGEHVILSRKGKPIVALVNLEDLALIEKLEDQIDVREAKKVLAEMKRTGEKPKPLAQVRKELGL